jgi:hypothetical protein
MKNGKLLLMFIGFICVITCSHYINRGSLDKQNRVLKNDVFFEGRVWDIKTSNNHSFGIIVLNLDTANVNDFLNSLKIGIYPYKIKGKKAELYTFIPDGIVKGNRIGVNSNNAEYYFITKANQRFKGSLDVLTNNISIDFVKENTTFR